MPEKPLEGSFDIEAGSRNTVSARAAVGGRTGLLSWRLGGQSFTTDGISAIAPAFGGGERDGYRNRSVTGRPDLPLAQKLAVGWPADSAPPPVVPDPPIWHISSEGKSGERPCHT